MRLRFSSKKTSSLSPQVSAAAVSVPSAIDRAASFAGCRNTTRTRCRPSSRAIAKFPPAPGVGHLATVDRLLRSTTTTQPLRRPVPAANLEMRQAGPAAQEANQASSEDDRRERDVEKEDADERRGGKA